MTNSLEALIAAADKATPGQWCTDSQNGVIADAGLNGNYYVAKCSGLEFHSNAAFIALANPENIKALIAALEQAQQSNKRRDDDDNDLMQDVIDIVTLMQSGTYAENMARSATGRVLEAAVNKILISSNNIDLHMRIAELENQLRQTKETLSTSAPRIAPHKYRECVGELTEDARKYAGTEQLWERLSYVLGNYVTPDHPHNRPIESGGAVKK